MKKAQILCWKVKYFNCNAQRIEDYDIFNGHYKEFVKKLKKRCSTKGEFSEAMDHEMMRMFWARAEWELVIELTEDSRIWLNPWVGCREPENARIDVTNDTSFDWRGFIDTLHLHDNCEKIDIYDMLKYRWDDFITYLWTTRQKYEHWDKKYE